MHSTTNTNNNQTIGQKVSNMLPGSNTHTGNSGLHSNTTTGQRVENAVTPNSHHATTGQRVENALTPDSHAATGTGYGHNSALNNNNHGSTGLTGHNNANSGYTGTGTHSNATMGEKIKDAITPNSHSTGTGYNTNTNTTGAGLTGNHNHGIGLTGSHTQSSGLHSNTTAAHPTLGERVENTVTPSSHHTTSTGTGLTGSHNNNSTFTSGSHHDNLSHGSQTTAGHQTMGDKVANALPGSNTSHSTTHSNTHSTGLTGNNTHHDSTLTGSHGNTHSAAGAVGTAHGAATHGTTKPSMMEKVKGSAEVMVGKMTSDPAKVEHGTVLKTGGALSGNAL